MILNFDNFIRRFILKELINTNIIPHEVILCGIGPLTNFAIAIRKDPPIIPLIKEKIGAEKLSKYEYWTSLAVKCAEMIFTESGMGKDKKAYVVEFLNNMFNKKKTVITEKQIEILIESCVKEMKIEETN